jgi:hypothetical protein
MPFRRAADIDDVDLPAVGAGGAGPRKCVRHTSILPCEEFPDRRSRVAVAQIPRGQQRARRAGPAATHLHAADRRTLHRPGLLKPCQMFSKMGGSKSAARRGAARKSASTTTEAVPAPRRPHWSAPVCRRAPPRLFRDAGRACRGPGARTNSRSDGARLWNRPYTLWRADRPAICGGNAVLH